MKRKDERNEIVLFLYSKGFASRKIGSIMNISHTRAASIITKYYKEETIKRFRKCATCGSQKNLLFNSNITICKKCQDEFRKIV